MTTTKQFGTFVANRHPIVGEFAASTKDHEVPSIACATSVRRGLRRRLEEISGAVDAHGSQLSSKYHVKTTSARMDMHFWTKP